MKVNFDDLAVDERRIVLVASDSKYQEIIDQTDWKRVALAAGGPMTFYLGGGLAGGLALAGALFGAAAASSYLGATFLAMDALAKEKSKERPFLKRVFTKGELPIPHLAPAGARSRFRFDVGGPDDGAIYIANPCLPDYYLPPAVVNERLAQEKLAAFMQIASALGAKKIDVKSGESMKTEAKGEAELPLTDAAAQVGLGDNFKSSNAFDRQVVAEFGKPTKAPHVPHGFDGWLDTEPTLRGMVRTRLDGEPTKIAVSLQFGSMVDIGADATAKFSDRGLKVGGAFRKVATSRWSFDVEFWPKE